MSEKLNSTCKHCHERFNSYNSPLIIQKPCGHLSHEMCSTKSNCLVCGCAIIKKLHEKDIVKDSQDDIDIRSMKRTDYKPAFKDYLRGAFRVPLVLFYFIIVYIKYLCNTMDFDTVKWFARKVTGVVNVHVTIRGEENVDNKKLKVIVSNHVSYHDVLILPRCLKGGILASHGGMNNIIAPILASGVNILVIDRGTAHHTVKQMSDFIETRRDSLFIFPQAIFSGRNTLTRFRTGAFATKYPVQPVVIKYKQDIASMSDFIDLLTFPRLDVEMIILPIVTRDKDESVDAYAERVRRYMAEQAGFDLSQVDSHDVTEEGTAVTYEPTSGQNMERE